MRPASGGLKLGLSMASSFLASLDSLYLRTYKTCAEVKFVLDICQTPTAAQKARIIQSCLIQKSPLPPNPYPRRLAAMLSSACCGDGYGGCVGVGASVRWVSKYSSKRRRRFCGRMALSEK